MADTDFIADRTNHIKSPSLLSVKAERHKREETKAFFNEIISIDILNQDGTPREGCSWKIPRFRLTPSFLQDLVNKSPAGDDADGCEISYLRHDGETIQPTAMQAVCRPHPASYSVVTKNATRLQDVLNDERYEGDVKFVLRSVPHCSHNEMHFVSKHSIKRWVINGVLDEDIPMQKLAKKVKDLQSSMDSVNAELLAMPTGPIHGSNGKLLKGKKADRERMKRLEDLRKEEARLGAAHDEAVKKLDESRQHRFNSMQVNVHVVEEEVDEVNKRSTWVIAFLGADKDYHERLALRKHDWSSSCLYAGSDEQEDELVDMSAVTMQRIEHGQGCFHNPPDGLYYHGPHQDGIRSGSHGMLYSSAGVYSGELEDGNPSGLGTMDYADGDKLTGSFRVNTVGCRQSVLGPNPYAQGLPHGLVKITFTDGSFYDGEMEDGLISGKGIYIDAMGDQYEGEFHRGVLKQGKIRFASGETREGNFIDGELDGMGTCRNVQSEFSGFFENGLKCGKGKETYHNSNTFVGFFMNDQRAMHGVMQFDSDADSSKPGPILESPWLAGRVRSGGAIVLDAELGTSTPSFEKTCSSFKWLSHLQKKEDRDKQRFARDRVERAEKDSMFRHRIREKKKKIFEAHQSQLKKKLGDTGGASEKGNSMVESKLPSRASHFPYRLTSSAPTTVEEARERPGLSSEVKSPKQISNLRLEIRKMEEEAVAAGLIPRRTDLSKAVQDEFECIEEKFGLISR